MAKFTKQELIQKISCHLAGAPVTETPAVEKTATQDVIPSALLKEASEKMSFMIKRMQQQEEMLQKIALENKSLMETNAALQSQIERGEREHLAEEVVEDMLQKNLITNREASGQKEKLMAMTKESFEEFCEVIEKIAASEVQKFGLDNLQYILPGGNMDVEQDTPTMLDVFSRGVS